MSLRTKITLVLLGVIGLFATANYVIQQEVFFTRFEGLEEELAIADMQRVQAALQEELRDVESLAKGWANWDALYHFAESLDPNFQLTNLSHARLEKQDIDLLFITGNPSVEPIFVQDADGGTKELDGYHPVLWSRVHLEGAPEGTSLSLFPRGHLSPGHPLASQSDQETGRSGILLTEHRPLLVASLPIKRSNGDGISHGTLILGRFLDGGLGGTLSEQTQVDFDAYQADGFHPLPAAIDDRLSLITSSPSPIIQIGEDDLLHAYGTFNDIRQRPEIVLHARIPRKVSAVGATALRSGLLSTITGGIVLLFVLVALLRRIVLGPLAKLTQHAEWIGTQEDFRAKLGMDRDDELGVLSREFDRMMEQLEEARAAYVETARSAGMSQVATGILHNVGNVLSSVNVATDMVSQAIKELSVGDLEKLSGIVEEHSGDLASFVQMDARGKHLQPFLSALSAQLVAQRDAALEEVSGLARGVEHICELVKSQQSYSMANDLREPTDLARLLDEAARIAEQALFADPKMEVIRSYESMPDIEVDRHRILEILINLVTNARQAMDGADDRTLTLKLFKRGGKIHLHVQDTGKGLAPEEITQIFNAGYSTKKSGMGYGLHSAANAATECHGKLHAHSEGTGKGATFVLEIPCQVRKTKLRA